MEQGKSSTLTEASHVGVLGRRTQNNFGKLIILSWAHSSTPISAVMPIRDFSPSTVCHYDFDQAAQLIIISTDLALIMVLIF